LKETAAFC